ncbi:type II toxin-antitoxin system VapC family toxin [Sphingomonas abietis]|uniref:Type II toxin-antitoxin system VapC family toxin n=1 Tax=Sphingomonas abietis TaxID=3012344 RepID=A0ABY7NMA3_9SPHN|nr:type II toxin-antitoxin system VapC family toxin [Sphingomonas abietis]WBO21763.1 type II toxin-antitoxin system VapC family toxin [Sphingomonas abietis]
MNGWLLDTHVISALASPNGAPSVKAWAANQPEYRMYLSVLTLAEYEKGIHNLEPDHPDRSRYMAVRDALIDRFSDRILSVDDAIIYRWGAISGDVKRQTRQAPPVIDTMLAATSIEHDLFLVTRNVKDTQHSGAAIFNPWEDDPERFPLT